MWSVRPGVAGRLVDSSSQPPYGKYSEAGPARLILRPQQGPLLELDGRENPRRDLAFNDHSDSVDCLVQRGW
jgi:hypothetical protein